MLHTLVDLVYAVFSSDLLSFSLYFTSLLVQRFADVLTTLLKGFPNSDDDDKLYGTSPSLSRLTILSA